MDKRWRSVVATLLFWSAVASVLAAWSAEPGGLPWRKASALKATTVAPGGGCACGK